MGRKECHRDIRAVSVAQPHSVQCMRDGVVHIDLSCASSAGLSTGTSAPKALAVSAISRSSVETTTRSIVLDLRAISIE